MLGADGYFVRHLLDKGYKQYFGNQQSFLDILTGYENELGGRVGHHLPTDPSDPWVDQIGHAHPPPLTPPNIDRGNLLWEVQANSSRTMVTSLRWVAEANFMKDWAYIMTGGRGDIPQQLLDSYGKQPTPQVLKIFVVNAIQFQLMADFATPLSEVFELPPNVTYADIGRQMLERLDKPNWLDPLRTGSPSPFNRANIFSKPTLRELRLGQAALVNCLDPDQTGFPLITPAELNEFCTGPYLSDLSRSYVSSIRFKELERNNLPYVNLANYHELRRQLSTNIEGWIFDQVQPPINWYGVWPGLNQANTTPWQPVRILTIPAIPSRYKSNISHTVVLAYVPTAWHLVHNAPGFKSPSLQRIQMYICGPRVPGRCKVGARTSSSCAHTAAGVYICGLLAHNPALFKSTWRELNYIDAARDQLYTTDVLSGLCS